MSRGRFIRFLVVSLLLLGGGCGTLNRQSVIQDADMAMVSELMAPLYTGQAQLVETFGTTDHDRIIFRVKNKRVTRVTGPVSPFEIWSPEYLLFFRVADAPGSHRALYYFDSQTLRLIPLRSKGDEGGSSCTETPATFTLFKALSHGGRWVPGDQALSLMRLHFEYTPSGTIRYRGSDTVPGLPGDPILPVHLRETGRVFFLSRIDEGPYGLFSVDETGRDLKTHLGDGAGRISRIYSEDGIHLIFESDKKGYQSLFRLTPDDGEVTDYTHEEADLGGQGRYVLTSRFSRGAFAPAIVKIPETLNMAMITSLVMAQNPQVAMKRALFAASLVTAGIATLPNYPSLYFELGTISPAGLLDNGGGFVSQTLINGLFGIIQPLFEIRRNTELGRAAELTAETAKTRLDNEINERVAEAMGLYFDITYAHEMGAIWEGLMAAYEIRVRHYTRLKAVGDTYGLQQLAAHKIVVAGRSEQAHHQRRALYLMRRLKTLCGISPDVALALDTEAFCMDAAPLAGDGSLHDLALLNHPQIQAVAGELKKAHFLESAGPTVRARMSISAEYEYIGRGAGTVVSDDFNLTLAGRLSSAQGRSDRLHRHYWARIKDSLRIHLATVSGQVRLSLDEALMDFRAAKNDYEAKRADTRYALEKIRVSRLYASIGTLDEDGGGDPLGVNTAVQEYLDSLARLATVRRDLGVRYVNVWRETGRSRLLPEVMTTLRSQDIDRQKASLWLWKSREVIDSPAGIAAFLRMAKAGHIKRVYAYLYSDARLLTEMMSREQWTLFLNACVQEGIEVWALLGEPEWLMDEDGGRAVSRGLQRVLAFNASKNSLEPKISGVKLDLEPHSFPGWETDTGVRDTLNARYLRILKGAMVQLRGRLPLWVDCPVKYFIREEHGPLMAAIARLSDGITAMVYFNDPKTVISVAKKVLKGARGPVEIGLEFSSTAPASDTLGPLTETRWRQLVGDISGQCMGIPGYMGLSFHDTAALTPILDEGQLFR